MTTCVVAATAVGDGGAILQKSCGVASICAISAMDKRVDPGAKLSFSREHGCSLQHIEINGDPDHYEFILTARVTNHGFVRCQAFCR